MFKLYSRVDYLEFNTAKKWQIEYLESQINALQQLIISTGLVEKYVDPIEKGETLFRLNDQYYKVKKGK